MKKKQQVALALAIIIIVAAAVAYEVISAKPSTWHVVAPPLSGSGTQDTTEFIMDNMWRVEWVINMQKDPLFILEVHRKNDTGEYSLVTDTSATDVSAAQGTLPVPYTGTFVMRVIASNETEWTLLIEEREPA
jgi:hypothetical protein